MALRRPSECWICAGWQFEGETVPSGWEALADALAAGTESRCKCKCVPSPRRAYDRHMCAFTNAQHPWLQPCSTNQAMGQGLVEMHMTETHIVASSPALTLAHIPHDALVRICTHVVGTTEGMSFEALLRLASVTKTLRGTVLGERALWGRLVVCGGRFPAFVQQHPAVAPWVHTAFVNLGPDGHCSVTERVLAVAAFTAVRELHLDGSQHMPDCAACNDAPTFTPAVALEETLRQLRQLQSLTLNCCVFDDTAHRGPHPRPCVPRVLEVVTTALTSLNIPNCTNPLHDYTAPHAYHDSARYTALEAWETNIKEEPTYATTLLRFAALKSLDFSGNFFTNRQGFFLAGIPECMPHLEALALRDVVQLDVARGFGLRSLRQVLPRLTTLTKLDLRHSNAATNGVHSDSRVQQSLRQLVWDWPLLSPRQLLLDKFVVINTRWDMPRALRTCEHTLGSTCACVRMCIKWDDSQ